MTHFRSGRRWLVRTLSALSMACAAAPACAWNYPEYRDIALPAEEGLDSE
jgi:hypothetical protein